ncbi:MAG: sigma 54-interacting transcriptional regulator, partial [Desulfohalobiaceae bacterium]
MVGQPIYSFLPELEYENVQLALGSLTRESPLTAIETELTDWAGGRRIVHWVGKAVFAPDGAVCEYLAIGRDSTDEIELEQILRRSNQRLKMALEATAVGIFEWDLPSGSLYVNPEWLGHLGYGRGDFGGDLQAWQELSHPEDLGALVAAIDRIRGGEHQEFGLERRVRKGSGEYAWILTRGRVTAWDASGAPLQVSGTAIDISFWKEAEKQLREQEEFLNEVLNSMSAKVAVLDQEGVIIKVNQAWNSFFQNDGSRELLTGIGTNYLDVCDSSQGDDSEGSDEVAKGIREVLAGSRPSYSREYPCHSAVEERWFTVQATPLILSDRIRGVVVAHFDITDRILAERAFREKNELHLKLFTNNTAVMLLIDPESMEIVEANKAACRFYGYSPEEIKGSKINLINTYSEDTIRRYMEKALAGNGMQFAFSHRLSNGEIREVSVHCGPMRIRGRDHICAIVHDVTEKKRMEHEFLRAVQIKEDYRLKLEAVFSSIPDPIITVDRNLRIISANKAAEKLCGCSGRNLANSLVDSVFPSRTCPVRSLVEETVRSKKPVRERRIQCRPGSHQQCFNPRDSHHLILSCTPLEDGEDGHGGAVMLMRDVSRQAELERAVVKRHSFGGIIGKSRVMRELYGLLERMAEIETTVLVTGESGTGKELISEALHYKGARGKGPLIRVNCAALSEQILESELFGHVRGAFTGAVKDREGRFQAAAGGTIFLDEIGEISTTLQVKLLRFLESKEFERVGESRTVKSDARIIAATNADLRVKVSQGEFREDLYYRLKVMHLHMPPLRQRREDIPLLVNHFLDRFRSSLSSGVTGISREVMELFMIYAWPGNVRELKHVLEHACILCPSGEIGPEHLPSELKCSGTRIDEPAQGEPGLTRAALVKVLQETGGNKAKAARVLGIGRATLYRKISEFGII